MRETDLLRMQWIADPQIAPDGRRVAFTRVTVDEEKDTYRTCLWLAPSEGGAPRALTFGVKDTQPRWSPDGRRLAFVRAAEEGKPGQLFVLPMEGGGEASRLTDLPKGAGNPAWSPDGRWIAFTSGTNVALDGATTAEHEEKEKSKPKKEPGRIVTRPFFRLDNAGFFDVEHPEHVWVVATDGSAPPRQLTAGRFDEVQPAFARDGRRVLFLSDRRPDPWFGAPDQDVYAVAADRAVPASDDGIELVADAAGPIAHFHEGANGALLATGALVHDPPRSYDQGDLFLFEPPFPQTIARVLTGPYDHEVGDSTIGADMHAPRGGGALPLCFAPGGRHALCAVGRHGTQLVARVGVDDGVVEELTDERWEVQAGSATPDGATLALAVGGVDRPCVLAVLDVGTRALRVLFDPNEALFGESALGAVEETWISSFDGTKIHAWIVQPPGFDPRKKYPLVLEIHGGPHTAYGKGFYHEFHVLAEAGYVVLYTNPRGSTTYGQQFGNCIQYAYPGDDAKDLLACVDHVVGLGYVDPARIGVTGGSGGGLLTNWLITQTHRFKAAITQRCVSDWESFWYSADFTQFTPFWFRTPPFEDHADFRRRSPVHLARQIETPLLVLHSENDWRTPIAQGEAMFRALYAQKKPTVMARFPGEGHELTRSGAPSRRVQNQQLIRAWFDRWLLGKPAPEFDDPAVRAAQGLPAAAAARAPAGEPARVAPHA